MKKKLINQLESVGFEQKSAWLSIILNGNEICYFYKLGGDLDIDGTGFSEKGLNFEQILSAIKEHTGVDLQPKAQEAKRRELVIDKVKQMGLKYVDIHGEMYYHGFIGGQKATYDPRTDNFWFCDLLQEYSEADVKNPTVKEVIELVIRYTSLDYSKPKKTKTQRIEALEELVKLQNEAINKLEERTKQNAQKKQLKLGGWAEVVGNTTGHGFENGQKVLVGSFNEDSVSYVCCTVNSYYYCNTQDLKPL